MVGMPIRVLLADDEALLRAGLRLILRHAEDVEVVAEVGDGAQTVAEIRRQAVDVVLLDIRMPGVDGLSAAEEIARIAPEVRVVMLTTFGEEEYVARALRAGAVGFLLKDAGPEELIHAVRAAAADQAVLSPRITRQLIDRYRGGEPDGVSEARRRIAELTDREREVLVMLGAGLSNADIGKRLYLGGGTVKTHVSRILRKLDCANRVQAAILAHDAGLLPDP